MHVVELSISRFLMTHKCNLYLSVLVSVTVSFEPVSNPHPATAYLYQLHTAKPPRQHRGYSDGVHIAQSSHARANVRHCEDISSDCDLWIAHHCTLVHPRRPRLSVNDLVNKSSTEH